jgi:putative phosphoribosyl transferase
MIFKNRQRAGKLLASHLIQFKHLNLIILALPRGGVPIGFEVARILKAPLDIFNVRKIGAPNNAEFGIGAVSEENVQVLDKPTIKLLKISEKELEKIIEKEKVELKRRIDIYRDGKPFCLLKNRTVILVDDGLATGVTVRAAIVAIKKHKPKQIILAFPVCAYEAVPKLSCLVDNIICVTKPVNLSSIGSWYQNFDQISDEKVIELLKRSRQGKGGE